MTSRSKSYLLVALSMLSVRCFVNFDDLPLREAQSGSIITTAGRTGAGGSNESAGSSASAPAAELGGSNATGGVASGGSGAFAGSNTASGGGDTGSAGASNSQAGGALACENSLDCNGAIEDGCECKTAECCGSACQTKHTTGTGQEYYDCSPLNTYGEEQAMKACTLYAGGEASKCVQKSCDGMAICSEGLDVCACWGYSGNIAGRVYVATSSPRCWCPSPSAPQWH